MQLAYQRLWVWVHTLHISATNFTEAVNKEINQLLDEIYAELRQYEQQHQQQQRQQQEPEQGNMLYFNSVP